jgi:hypothetical protein
MDILGQHIIAYIASEISEISLSKAATDARDLALIRKCTHISRVVPCVRCGARSRTHLPSFLKRRTCSTSSIAMNHATRASNGQIDRDGVGDSFLLVAFDLKICG